MNVSAVGRIRSTADGGFAIESVEIQADCRTNVTRDELNTSLKTAEQIINKGRAEREW